MFMYFQFYINDNSKLFMNELYFTTFIVLQILNISVYAAFLHSVIVIIYTFKNEYILPPLETTKKGLEPNNFTYTQDNILELLLK